MEEKNYELLLSIQEDIGRIKNYVTEIKEYEEPKLNAIQKEVNKRIQEKTGIEKDDLSFEIHFATKKFIKIEENMYIVTSYLDEIGKKVLDLEKLLKES